MKKFAVILTQEKDGFVQCSVKSREGSPQTDSVDEIVTFVFRQRYHGLYACMLSGIPEFACARFRILPSNLFKIETIKNFA